MDGKMQDLEKLEQIGEGATTKVVRDGDRAFKLYVDAPPGEAENEAMRQHFAQTAGLPVPEIYGVRKINEHVTALEMAYIDGRVLMHPNMDPIELRLALETLIELQRRIHATPATGLPLQSERLTMKIARTTDLEEKTKQNLLSFLRANAGEVRRLCHGDFHPFNVLYDGQEHWIIDWVDATAGNPLVDVCRSWLLLASFQTALAEAYLELYCRQSAANKHDILCWLPVVAAARLGENPDEQERERLMLLARKL